MIQNDEHDDVPVLSAVVESGNESIIQSSRLGRQVLRELEALRGDIAPRSGIDIDADRDADDQLVLRQAELSSSPHEADDMHFEIHHLPIEDDDDEIELMIDELVDRHITELRKDIRRLLERARHAP